MPDKTFARAVLLLVAALMPCAAALAGQQGTPAQPARPLVLAKPGGMTLAPLPRLPNGHLDSYAWFTRMATVRKEDVPGLDRRDEARMRALAAAIVRNDGAAVDSGMRELVNERFARRLGGAGTDIESMVALVMQMLAADARADLASKVKEMKEKLVEKKIQRDELSLLRKRLDECDRDRSCAPASAGARSDAAGAPDALTARRIDAMAREIAALAAHAERMHKVAQSVIDERQP